MASVHIPVSGMDSDLLLDNTSAYTLSVSVKAGDLFIETINVESDPFAIIRFNGYHSSNIIGAPELPEIHSLLELPQSAIPRIEIVSEEIVYYSLADFEITDVLYPHQPSLSKSQNPEDVPFEWDISKYEADGYIAGDLVSVDIKGMMRSLRLANLIIRPVDYNPQTGMLKVWKKLDFLIHFDNADIVATENLKEKYYSPYYESVYLQVPNYDKLNSRDDLVNHPVTYVIITNPIFANSLSDFINWKIEKGFNVVVGSTSEI